MMSAVVYDVVYDTRMIKRRKNMVTLQLMAAIKGTKNSQDVDRQKISRFRSTLPYFSFEYRNLRTRHTISLKISIATTVSDLF